MNFLLDSGRRTSKNGAMLLPKYDFVYAFLDVVDFHNWKSEKNEDCVTFVEHADFQPEHLTSQCIPIGGIEFCSEWYRQMGIRCILPLNIPDCLDSLVRRPIIRTNNLQWNGNRYFGKSMSEIKSDKNGWYMEYHERAPMLFTQEVENISSEWRFFVCNGVICGMKCYTGNPLAVPDVKYCKSVVDAIEDQRIAPAYALDLMVREDGATDIVEMHDFFACGLYGFDDPIILRRMAIATQHKLLTMCRS